MFGDGVCDFVAFENMLERAYFEPEVVRDPDEGENLVLALGMTVYETGATKGFQKSVEFEVLARRDDPSLIF